MKYRILILIFLLKSLSLHAGEQDTEKTIEDSKMAVEVKDFMRNIDEVKRLPATGLSYIKAGDKIFLTTDNGHFIVTGKFVLVDMWQGKVIKSITDMANVNKVDLRKIGIKPEEISSFTIGEGKKEVTVFIDPECPYCNNLINQMKPLGKDYKFFLALVPVLGKDSAEIIKKLICNKDKDQSFEALLSKNFSNLPALNRSDKSCDLKPLQKAIVMTKLLDIQGVPYTYLPSKNTFRGGAKSFKTVLEKDLEDEINGR